jgi:hypothetical protein
MGTEDRERVTVGGVADAVDLAVRKHRRNGQAGARRAGRAMVASDAP